MRADFQDVLITRGRRGAGWKKPGRRRKFEDCPRQEPIDRRGTKHFDDHLGPLKRFLASRVGRPWDDVWSELCGQLDRRGLLQRHVFVHLEQMVAIRVVRDGDRLVELGTFGPTPIRPGRWRNRFYVDPDTGRLANAAP